MKCVDWLGTAMSTLFLVAITTGPAVAETQFTHFNGVWQGTGQDRYSPLEAMQHTRCQTTVNADLRRMVAQTSCNGAEGLRKLVHLSITVNGSAFSGTITQRTRVGGDPETVLSGTVTGRKTDTTAEFDARFPGFVPNVAVALKLTTPNTYTMQARTLGGQLMDVSFKRSGR